MQLLEAIKDYKTRYADEQNLRAKTRKNRRQLMDRIALYFNNKSFDLQNCRGFLDELRKTNASASMRRHVMDIRAFVRFLFKYEYLEKDFSNKIPMPKVEDRFFNLISETQAKNAILEGTKPGRSDNRYAQKSKEESRMGLLFMLFTGLRNSELRGLQVEDFNISEMIFKVRSKGGKVELSNVPLNMKATLKTWIARKKTGQMFEAGEESLRITLHRGCKKLGLPSQRVHDLRHIFSLTRLKRREPLQLLSRALRHKKLATTDKYYSQYMITDLAPTVNNSAEIQKEVTAETVLDTVEQVLKNCGITDDPRFRFERTNEKITIEIIRKFI